MSTSSHDLSLAERVVDLMRVLAVREASLAVETPTSRLKDVLEYEGVSC